MTTTAPPPDLELLATLASHPSVRGAAAVLGVPRSSLGRRLEACEAHLGQSLFHRRGRRLAPTRFGTTVLAKAARARSALEELEFAWKKPAGDAERLTVAVAPLFAELVLPLVLPVLLRARPSLQVDVRLSQGKADIFDDQIDVALRRGPIADVHSLRARRLGRTTMLCVAAPSVSLRGHADPEDVARALPWIRTGTRLEPFTLTLARGKTRRNLTLIPRLSVDSQQVALALVRSGAGVARLNAFLVRDALARGELREVLPEARSTEDVFAVYPGKTPAVAVRTFLAALVGATRSLAIWD